MKEVSAKAWIPISVLVAGSLLGVGLVNVSPKVETNVVLPRPPLVRTIEVSPGPATLFIDAQGTVVPRTESELVPEVSAGSTL